MFYVYILKSLKDGKLYIGSTQDLKRRISEHLDGSVESTKYRQPMKLLCYESYTFKTVALKREKFLKSSDGHKDIYRRFK